MPHRLRTFQENEVHAFWAATRELRAAQSGGDVEAAAVLLEDIATMARISEQPSIRRRASAIVLLGDPSLDAGQIMTNS